MSRVLIFASVILSALFTVSHAFAMGEIAVAATAVPAMIPAGLAVAGSAIFALADPARARPRAISGLGVRADTGDPKTMIAAVQTAVTELRASLDEKLKAKVDDAVLTEKIGKIDASVDGFQKAIDDLNAKLAAANLGGGVIGDIEGDPEYVQSFKAHMRKGTVDAAMQKGNDQDGGYLAPIEWDRTITGKLKKVSPIRAHARVISISTAGFKKGFTDRAVGSGWVGETASRPATSTPGFTQLDYTIGEIYANPGISQGLLDDAALDLEQWLADEVDTEFARQEGIAFVGGNGVNKPHGVLQYVEGEASATRHPFGAIEVVRTGDAAKLTADSFLDLFYALPGEFKSNAKLFTSRGVQSAARKLKDGQGNYLWQPSFAQGQPATIGGEAVVEIADMPGVAAGNIVALYGDMAATYLVIDRIGIRVLRDPFTNKPFVHFYTTKRVGGGVINTETMKALRVGAAS